MRSFPNPPSLFCPNDGFGNLTAPTRIPEPDLAHQHLVQLSAAFLLDQATGGMGGLGPRDAVLVMAINQANIAPLTRQPEARRRYGALAAPAPDTERRPVSINAIAASLCLPFETVRRNVRRLEALGVCVQAAGGVIVPETFLASPAYLASVMAGHHHLRAFHARAAAEGLIGPLPASSYAMGDEVPVRAAARLVADYILRAVESLMATAGDVVSVLVFLALMEGAPRPLTAAALAQRLRVPVQTVRRHASDLAAAGHIGREARGFVLAPAHLARPTAASFARANAIDAQRLFAGLAERGIVDAWAALA